MRKANLGYSFIWHAGKRLKAAISLSAVLSGAASAALALVVVLVPAVMRHSRCKRRPFACWIPLRAEQTGSIPHLD
jgi:hypothetical protein